MLYQAYLDGNLDDNAFELFMDRMYQRKFNESFNMPSPYRVEQKIDTLIKILELDGLIEG
ncbi:hypothetical protein QWY31_10080 [Cytophagales bacterium LB-30]|uniref:Uncharacterized protein n=1 Tax=Shiella aurantiaca TaxID=3058365 RepID=A0ABT8F5V3_9BACT|nr:hypothetical protein [Shiella aurantiaca]